MNAPEHWVRPVSAYEHLLNTVRGRLANRDLAGDDDVGLRQLIEDEIERYQRGAYSEASGGDDGPLTDPDAVRDRLFGSIRGNGPFDAPLANRRVREVRFVDEDVWCVLDDGSRWQSTEPTTAHEVRAAAERLVDAAGGVVLDESHPGVGGLRIFLPDGRQARLSVSISPRIDGVISGVLRIPQHKNLVFEDYQDMGSLNQAAANVLQLAAVTNTGVLLAGPAGAGKTTLLDTMMRIGGDTRTYVLEQMRELQTPLLDGEKWAVNPAEDTATQAIELLTYSPERCVFAEFKGPEAWAMTRLAAIGVGIWVAVHAHSAADAIKALAWAAKAAPEAANLTVFELEQRFSELLQVVVYCGMESRYSSKANRRAPLQRVTEIAVHVPGTSGLGVNLQPIFTRDGDIEAPLRWTEAELPANLQQRFDDILRHQGLRSIDILHGSAVKL